MIPSDLASRLQVTADAALRPVANIQEITDRLAGLAPGQRLMAEIQALMPNGTYRALINQRDVTLALPFAAKAGDALELEVVGTEGKLTLAVLSRPAGEAGKTPAESVPTTLSRTGQLIGSLFGGAGDAKSAPEPTALNANRPIAGSPPLKAQDILPQLKLAIAQSGLFYESHQAGWVDGRFPKSALLQEPQGRLPPQFATAATAQQMLAPPALPQPGADTYRNAHPKEPVEPGSQGARGEPSDLARRAVDAAQTAGAGAGINADKAAPGASQPAQLVAAPALPLVQQQLEALATQNFIWQGQAWPGQTMRWEIEEDAGQRGSDGEETASRWQTSLRLTLPRLGEIDARIGLQGPQIALALAAGNTGTQALLRDATEALRGQLDAAGLVLASLGVGPAEAG
ncbi:MAG: flagellar hook-length control protein FliK [Betaproteobacteria bacterium]|nr:flagellar hook-length control protein FliK [Betaproteobacteria bacterium]